MKNIAAVYNHNCNFCLQMLPRNRAASQSASQPALAAKTQINLAQTDPENINLAKRGILPLSPSTWLLSGRKGCAPGQTQLGTRTQLCGQRSAEKVLSIVNAALCNDGLPDSARETT